MKRFWDKVTIKKDNECWFWNGTLNATGYGLLWRGQSVPESNNKGRYVTAHRMSLYLAKGIWESDKQVLHSCDNRACVNPAHLRWGTQQDNIRDKVKRGRVARPIRYPQKVIDAVLTSHPLLTHAEVSFILHIPPSYVSRLRRGIYTHRGEAKYKHELQGVVND